MSMLFKSVRQISRSGVRNMSAHSEQEAAEQVARWTQISKVMMGVVGVMSVYNGVVHFSGHHEEHAAEHPPFSYLKLRTKPFPWKHSDCNWLDFECKEKAEAAKKALAE